MKKVLIIGGGATSLLTAYFLLKEGFEITVVSKGDFSEDNLGSAGLMIPNHIIRLFSQETTPSVSTKQMVSSNQPFYINPDLNRQISKRYFHAYQSVSGMRMSYNIKELAKLRVLSQDLYLQLTESHLIADFGMEKEGLLMLYRTEAAAKGEAEIANIANLHGIKAQVLTRREVQALEPNLKLNVVGGVLYPGDLYPNPKMLNNFLSRYLEQKGVKMLPYTSVQKFVYTGNTIKSVQTTAGNVHADYVIVRAGTCTREVASKLDLPLSMGKGLYFKASKSPISRPSMLVEEQISITPTESQVYVGSVKGYNRLNNTLGLTSKRRINDAVGNFYEYNNCSTAENRLKLNDLQQTSKCGLPSMGFSQSWDNVLFGEGGLRLAPAIGKLLTEQVIKTVEPKLQSILSAGVYRCVR